MRTATYAVEGMVCDHCVAAVRAELERIPGVTRVRGDLAAGTVTVTSEQALDGEVVRAAVEEAGFQLGR
jgi:copper chaperone CopZ